MKFSLIFLSLIVVLTSSCQSPEEDYILTDQAILESAFGTNINLEVTAAYQNTEVPSYIRFALSGNAIDDKKAVLGRILFYDKQLSVDNSISCANCHQQENAFSDTDLASVGINGVTSRHSMRLVNTGFKTGTTFFWDERVNSLEAQVTQPIRDHIEMDFSGQQEAPTFDY
jgi:cytochrome c peroxidase